MMRLLIASTVFLLLALWSSYAASRTHLWRSIAISIFAILLFLGLNFLLIASV